jgi:hypothetical protein
MRTLKTIVQVFLVALFCAADVSLLLIAFKS